MAKKYIYIENNELNAYYNMKKVIRLTENNLHKIVKESTKKILREKLDDSPANRMRRKPYDGANGVFKDFRNVTIDEYDKAPIGPEEARIAVMQLNRVSKTIDAVSQSLWEDGDEDHSNVLGNALSVLRDVIQTLDRSSFRG